MSEILVNKRDLKNIRDTADKLLKSGRRHVQFATYEREQLSGRHKKILIYVEKNPGATKEDVIKNNPVSMSRMTIVKLINDLIEMRMLTVRHDDSNQHIQHLHNNSEHVVLALINDLEFFKLVYFRLIDETAKKLKELWIKYQKKVVLRGRHTDIWWDMWRLRNALLMPYKNLIVMYVTSDLLFYPERALDKETLRNKFAMLGGTMKEIQTKIHESIIDLYNNDFYEFNFLESAAMFDDVDSSFLESGLSREHLVSFLRNYWVFRLGAFAEPVLDILWKISYPVLKNDPFCDDLEMLKDWRNIISGDKEFNYVPKTTQAQNLGKALR